uniref:Uncharacterized protein n=1 Tax=Ascaris lumbricoides TaxID=6252 RepID=A0A0M3I187_ASCLU
MRTRCETKRCAQSGTKKERKALCEVLETSAFNDVFITLSSSKRAQRRREEIHKNLCHSTFEVCIRAKRTPKRSIVVAQPTTKKQFDVEVRVQLMRNLWPIRSNHLNGKSTSEWRIS